MLVRLPRGNWPFAGQGRVGNAVLAADLLESADPRAVQAGADQLNELSERLVGRP